MVDLSGLFMSLVNEVRYGLEIFYLKV